MLEELRELWRFRELLFTMVQRELKIRYKNSALGFFWSLLNPLVTVVVLSFVVTNFMMSNAPPGISAYILVSYLPFTFFQLCVMDSAQSVLGAMPLIKKIYFPREILPLASVISNFIHLLLSMAVFFVYLLVLYAVFPPHVWPFQIGTLYLPLLLAISFALALGLTLYVSALNTFYEDVKYIVGIGLWLMFFLTPVMYFSERVENSGINLRTHGLVYKVYNLNPVSALSSAYRKVLLAPPTVKLDGSVTPFHPLDWRYVGFAGLLSIILVVGGYATFNRMKWRFVERP